MELSRVKEEVLKEDDDEVGRPAEQVPQRVRQALGYKIKQPKTHDSSGMNCPTNFVLYTFFLIA
jgi:hypothetical protein